MNSNRVNGKVDEVLGSIKRKAGKITGNTPLQVKGIAQQTKGKIESTLGKAADAVSGATKGIKAKDRARIG